MKLTKIQLRLLKNYVRYHDESITVATILRLFWWPWLVLLICAIFGFWATMAVGVPDAAWLVLGICFGAFLRDIGRIQVLFRTWPILPEITNWDRVRELIATQDKAT